MAILMWYDFPISDSGGNQTQTSSCRPLSDNESITENNLPKRKKRNEAAWRRNVKKSKRNSGHGKQFINTPCSCIKKCHENISVEQREMSFKAFWNLENFSKQNSYICGLVKRQTVKQRRKRDGSRSEKGCTNKYFLTINNESLNVCKQYFICTFQISDGRMTRALKKEQQGRVGEDLRGKSTSANKTSEIKITEVRNHIRSFPAYTSHYTRHNNPNRRYLDSGLNIRKMFNLYVKTCEETNIQPVSETIYRSIFYEENLHFHAPLKDTCLQCEKLKLKIEATEGEEKDNLKSQHELHLRKAEKARQAMTNDGELKPEDGYHIISFDLQKALAFPNLTTSVAYYKRNLYCYNLGVHNLQTNKAYMYVWDETKASRGSQEVASCLLVHIANEAVGKKTLDYV